MAAALAFLGSFCFFQFAYPYHLMRREQLNLFLFDGDYIAGTYRGTGWLVRFVADFLEQFFHLPVAGPLIVALILTAIGWAAFKIGQSSDGHPNFFTKKNIERGKKYRVDFFLEPLDAAETEFTLFAIGDPQCRNTAEVARYTTETIKKIKQDAADAGHVYAVTLGDVTFDSNDTYYPMYSSMKNVKAGSWTIPFFQCMGNHDHDATKVVSSDDQPTMQYKAQGTYVSYFGPQDYSFDRGDAHIIVMDNVWVYGSSSTSNSNKVTCSYYSGFSDQQYAWLQQDIANVENPASKVVLLCCHIPFRGGGSKTGSNMNKDKHYADVLTLMKQFNEAHIMIGHTHYNQNYIHTAYTTKNGQPVYEHIHGAACGAWWASNSNVTGGPNGFTAYHFNGPTIRNWQGMNTNFENSFQLRVYDGNQEFSGSKGYRLKWSNSSVRLKAASAMSRSSLSGSMRRTRPRIPGPARRLPIIGTTSPPPGSLLLKRTGKCVPITRFRLPGRSIPTRPAS